MEIDSECDKVCWSLGGDAEPESSEHKTFAKDYKRATTLHIPKTLT
jgi:hypothetical protein